MSRRIRWSSGGFFSATPTSVGILKATVKVGGDIVAAIQSKPIVVAASKIDIRRETSERFNRAAVAVRTGKQGAMTVILAGAFAENDQAMSFCEFAQFLAMSQDAGGPGASDALAMDGGPGAHLYLPSATDPKLQHFGLPVLNYVPNLLMVSRRAPP